MKQIWKMGGIVKNHSPQKRICGMVFHRYSGCRKVKKIWELVWKAGSGQLRKGGKGIGRFAVALIVAYAIAVLALFGIAFVMLEAAAGCGDDGASDPCGLCSFMFCRRLVRRTAGRTAEVPAGTAGGSSVFCHSVSDFRDGRTGDSVRSGQRRTCMPSVRSRWHAWRHAGLKTAEKLFLFNYKMV